MTFGCVKAAMNRSATTRDAFFPCVLEFSNTISVLQCMVVGCPLHLEEGESLSQVGTLFEFQVSSFISLATFATTILLFGSNSCIVRVRRVLVISLP